MVTLTRGLPSGAAVTLVLDAADVVVGASAPATDGAALLGCRLAELGAPSAVATLADALARCRRTGTHIELAWTDRDGATAHVRRVTLAPFAGAAGVDSVLCTFEPAAVAVSAGPYMALAESAAHADVALYRVDVATGELHCTPSLFDIYGVEPTATFDDMLTRLPPAARAELLAVRAEAMAFRQSDTRTRVLHYQVEHPHKGARHIEVRFRYVFDDGPPYSTGVIMDVTDMRRAELTLRESSDWIDFALQAANVALWEVNVDTLELRGSAHLNTLFGLSTRVHGLTFGDFVTRVHADDRAATQAAFDAVLANGVAGQAKYRVVLPDGDVRWLESVARLSLANVSGQRPRLTGMTRDVTARERGVAALRESEATLARAMSAARCVPFDWYIDTRTVHGPAFLPTLFGLPASPGPWPLSMFWKHLHEDYRDAQQVTMEAALAAGGNFSVDVRVRRDDGDDTWLEVRGSTRVDSADGTVFQGVAIDISERRAAERELERLREQLLRTQKMESIGELTGGIAHDFNNIIAIIDGYNDLALRRLGAEGSPKLIGYLRQIDEAAGRAATLVQQLLTFSRPKAVQVEPVAPERIVADALRLLRPVLPSTLELDTRIARALPRVLCDADQVHQTIVNLCINARDALGGHGKVTLEIALEHARRMTCASCGQAATGAFLAVRVRDDGPGIPAALQARIFDPFFTTKPTGQGSGMGLSMVHGIVHAHGGHVLLDSVAGGGTCITLLLPTAAVDAGAGQPRRTVLVVDDEVAVAAYLRELLEMNDCAVTVETSPLAALARVRHAPDGYDCVVADQTMPGMTGIALAGALRDVRADLPVVLMSGHGSEIDEATALAAGARALLSKPIDERRLLELLAELQPPAGRAQASSTA